MPTKEVAKSLVDQAMVTKYGKGLQYESEEEQAEDREPIEDAVSPDDMYHYDGSFLIHEDLVIVPASHPWDVYCEVAATHNLTQIKTIEIDGRYASHLYRKTDPNQRSYVLVHRPESDEIYYLYVLPESGCKDTIGAERLIEQMYKNGVKVALTGGRGVSQATEVYAAVRAQLGGGQDMSDRDVYWVITDYELANLGAIDKDKGTFTYITLCDRPTMIAIAKAEIGERIVFPSKPGFEGIKVDHEELVDEATFEQRYSSGHLVDER